MIDTDLKLALRRPRIVFVCSGNMVRSAFAELYARHIGVPREISSIATTYRNDRIFPDTARALKRLGVDTDAVDGFVPTHMDEVPEPLDENCVLFAMTHSHLHALADTTHGATTFLMSRILGHGTEIADPVLEGADFGTTFLALERCVDALLIELERAEA
jgi:protein-tyrosine-phosphatase